MADSARAWGSSPCGGVEAAESATCPERNSILLRWPCVTLTTCQRCSELIYNNIVFSPISMSPYEFKQPQNKTQQTGAQNTLSNAYLKLKPLISNTPQRPKSNPEIPIYTEIKTVTPQTRRNSLEIFFSNSDDGATEDSTERLGSRKASSTWTTGCGDVGTRHGVQKNADRTTNCAREQKSGRTTSGRRIRRKIVEEVVDVDDDCSQNLAKLAQTKHVCSPQLSHSKYRARLTQTATKLRIIARRLIRTATQLIMPWVWEWESLNTAARQTWVTSAR